MFLNKVLANSRQVLSRGALPVKTLEQIVRQRHTLAVPATSPISTAEKVSLGLAVFASLWAIPFWILYHIPDYQNQDRNTYTGK